MKTDEQRMRDILVDTIRLLCRTGVEYSRRMRVQGLLGITVDDERVFLISVDDCIARNCVDVDDNLREFADEVNTASHSHVTSDDVNACVGSKDRNISEGVNANYAKQSQFDPAVQFPKHMSLSESAHNNVLASVALSEISSVVAASAQNLPSLQLSSQNVQLHGNIATAAVAETCREAEHNGNMMADTEMSGALETVEQNAAVNVPATSEPNEVISDTKNELPISVKMETDAKVGNRTENTVSLQQFGETNSSTTLYTTVDQNQCGVSLNLDDIDSSSADTNDSEHTSESEELPDHLSIAPRLDLISSVQYSPHGLLADVSRWPVGSIQHCRSDGGGADTVAIQPAMLTGVVANSSGSGSHASTYYHQQVSALFLLCPQLCTVYQYAVVELLSHM